MIPRRRFPPPWIVEDIGAAFVVIDSAGQSSATFITRTNQGVARRLLTKDEARRIAMNIAKLPELLR